VIIGTAGHIDHGKTSLVKAITGIDADRLKEEKARGITIDLGFAYWPQEDGSSIGFVDVPGHEGYIRNMLAGVTGVSALLLVVAANEGVKPQTREHLAIADLLGLDAGVVALTKSDLADAAMLESRIAELRALLAPTALNSAPIIPVSSATGEGLDVLKQALRALRGPVLADAATRPFRLVVDRVFTLAGAGTVVTGGVMSGEVRVDDRLLLSPSGQEVRVRGLHAQNRKADVARAGERAAVNLAGVGVEDVRRGDVLMADILHSPTQRFDVSLRLAPDEAKPPGAWTPVHVHSGTGDWTGRVVPLSDSGLAQIVLERPAAVLGGDCFILRDASGRRTIGGGTVLDIRAPQRYRQWPGRLKALGLLDRRHALDALPELLQLPPFAVDLESFAHDRGHSAASLDPAIRRDNLMILSLDDRRFVFSPAIVLMVSRRIQAVLADHHALQPDRAGLSAEQLRLALPERFSSEAFAALAAHLARRGEVAATGAWLRLPSHVPRLSAEHEALWAAIQPLLAGEERFKPPRVNELAEALRKREETVRGLMKRLARRGDVDEVAEDHYLLRASVAELLAAARETGAATPEGWFNAAAFRDRIGTGRRMAILILEFLDRHGVTVRKGDLRRVDARRAGMFGK
jgi:selenocysteine-specific elongation factor